MGAPDESLAVPAIAAWARATAGQHAKQSRMMSDLNLIHLTRHLNRLTLLNDTTPVSFTGPSCQIT